MLYFSEEVTGGLLIRWPTVITVAILLMRILAVNTYIASNCGAHVLAATGFSISESKGIKL